jgi:hypothetical protein
VNENLLAARKGGDVGTNNESSGRGRRESANREGTDVPQSSAPGKVVRSGEAQPGSALAPEAQSLACRLPGNADESMSVDDWTMTEGLSSAMGLTTVDEATSTSPLVPRVGGRVGKDIAPPKGGVNKTGFIDHSDGANLRSGPAEEGGSTLRSSPLPPATRVFVSGTHPSSPQWWYVTVFLPGEVVRGYVQDFRVATDLPEPFAKLHQVEAGDTARTLASREFQGAVRDGHDLRYYENVLLKVNRDKGRVGVIGSYQDPGIFGGGDNNVQLVAGHRIWLVGPSYARAVEGEVPDGSLSDGLYAKAKRFAAHLADILKSVTQSPKFLSEVSAEVAQVIADHIVEIVGIVAGFIAAEALSAFLAATPTGVGQIVAVLIQLALAAFGAYGAVEAGAQAMQHGSQWLNLAWTAHGQEARLAMASREFLKMLVAIAMAALAYTGAKGNLGNALKISSSMPMPALALAGGGQLSAEGAGTAVAIGGPGPMTGLGAGGSMMAKHDGEGGGSPLLSGEAAEKAREELLQIKQTLKEGRLSGKEKSRLRSRKNELQSRLGLAGEEAVVAEAAPRSDFKRRAAGLTGKEAATDIPGWAKSSADARPYVNESGVDFASRMMDKQYGSGKWAREGNQGTEFSQLKKFADRAFE